MGEYAMCGPDSIKIGTCEEMYYLRADQRHLIQGYEFDGGERFRFPWPDEDNIRPGQFENYERTCALRGMEPPAWVDHYTVQFRANAGYLTSLPCPEGGDVPEGVGIMRNGFAGAVLLCQQRAYEGKLVAICQCGGCGTKWRLETMEMAEEAMVALRSEADRRIHDARVSSHKLSERDILREGDWYHKIADRIAAGYRS